MSTVVIKPPPPPMATPPWGWLADALALAPSEVALRSAGLCGNIQARIVHHFRGVEGPVPPEYWNGQFDRERSRIRPCAHQDFDGRVSQLGWVQVQVNLQSVRECFGLDQQPAKPRPEEKRGNPGKYDWEQAGLEILGRICRREIPEPTELSDVKKLYVEWFAAKDMYPKKSMLYEHAEKLWKELS